MVLLARNPKAAYTERNEHSRILCGSIQLCSLNRRENYAA